MVFHRRPADRRLVRHAASLAHAPTHWLTMPLLDVECKLMEVRKNAAEYFDLDAKFRRPNLELITVYAVQNPYLYGAFVMRKEQMAMQQGGNTKAVKEKLLYIPVSFKDLDLVLRNNLGALMAMRRAPRMELYVSSEVANIKADASINPRVMILARVITSVVETASEVKNFVNEDGQMIDTLTNDSKTIYVKANVNEVYPDHVLVYRDLEGPKDDRTSRLTDVIKNCTLSYRAGTRFNPEEVMFQGAKGEPLLPDTFVPKKKGNSKSKKAKVITEQPKAEFKAEKETGAIPKRKSKDVKVSSKGASEEKSILSDNKEVTK